MMRTFVINLFILAAWCAAIFPADATTTTTIQVGEGSEQTEVEPFFNWWKNSYVGNEVLYLKDELTGLHKGDQIVSLSYRCCAGSASGGNFNFRLKNTSLTSFELSDDAFDTSILAVSCDDAVNGNVTLGNYSAGDWVTVVLDEPFIYDGENIIVDIRNTAPAQSQGWCYFEGTKHYTRRDICWRNANSEDCQSDGFHSGQDPYGNYDSGIYTFGGECVVPNVRITFENTSGIENVFATDISLNKPSTTIIVGDFEILEATITPSDVTFKKIEWQSSDPRIAEVDGNGKVTALEQGTATITATTTDGTGLTARCEVNVEYGPNTVWVGSGNEQNEVEPFFNWWKNSYVGNEVVYLKDELTGMRKGDKIVSLAYRCCSGSASGGNFNFRLKNTTLTSFAVSDDRFDTSILAVSCDDAVHANVTLGEYSAGDWVTIVLDEPFIYDGENIIVDIRNTAPAQSQGWCYFECTKHYTRRDIGWRNAKSEDCQRDGFKNYNDAGFYLFNGECGPPNVRITFESAVATGDLDSNGRIEVNDVVWLAEIAMGGSSIGVDISVADMDGNGRVDVNDVVAIADLVMGK